MSSPERDNHTGTSGGGDKRDPQGHPDLHIPVATEPAPSTHNPHSDAEQQPHGHKHGHKHEKPAGAPHASRRGPKAVTFAEQHADPHSSDGGHGVSAGAATGASGGHPPQPSDRSPFAMLMRSFVYPVSEEHALEDDIRMTLGLEPEGSGDVVLPHHAYPVANASGTGGASSPLDAVHANNRSSSSVATLVQAGSAPSRVSNADPSSPATGASPPDGTGTAFPHPSGVCEPRLATWNFSGRRTRRAGQTSGATTPALSPDSSFFPAGQPRSMDSMDRSGEEEKRKQTRSAAPREVADEDEMEQRLDDNEEESAVGPGPQSPATGGGVRLLGPVVPTLDSTQANHGLPHGEELYYAAEGEPYVFRYNIRVTEAPPPALLASDPVLLSALNHSIANGSLRGYSLLNTFDGNNSGGGNGSDSGEVNIQVALVGVQGAKPADVAGGGAAPQLPGTATAKDDDSVYSARESAAPAPTDGLNVPVGEVKPTVIETSTASVEKADHSSSSSSSSSSCCACRNLNENNAVVGKATATAASSCTASQRPVPLFSATEVYPLNGASSTAVAVREGAGNDANQTFLTTGSFRAEPILMDDVQRERIIVDCFNSLSSETRRVELLEAFYVAHIQPYEGKDSFTADNWDDVMARTHVPQWFGVEFDRERYCFYVTVFRHQHRVFFFSFLLRCFCIFLFWVLMFCMLPPHWFSPGGMYFDTISTILFAGIVGTMGSRLLGIPTLIGVIWAGILWNNIPYTGRLTSGITFEIRQFMSFFGLSIGIIRAGLSINVIRFKQKFKHFITFSILPMTAEMIVHGVCAKAIYNLPNYRWAFAEGFLLSAIAPSVVVPTIIAYQRRGYGVRDGPPMMMVCSIAIDTAICLWGIQFLLALEFKTMATATVIILAPMQVAVGIVGGVVLGCLVFTVTFYVLFMEAERLPGVRSDRRMTLRHSVHVRYLSIGFMVLVAFTCFSVGRRVSCVGGAAIGVVTVAGTFNYLCVRGGTRDHLRVKADMAQTLTTVWDYIAMPSLFGLTGAGINVHELFARDFIGQAFALVFIGIAVRGCVAMMCPIITRLGLSWPEIIFCGIGWIGKGSVQGSMGGTAQVYAQQELAAAKTPEEVAWAQNRVNMAIKMKNTAVLGILVACPVCSIFLTRFTSKLLKKGT